MFSFKATENLLDSLLIDTEPRYIRNGFLNFDRIKMETCHNTFTVKLCSGGITLAVAEVTPWAEADTVELVVHEGSIKIFLEDVPEQDDKKDIMNLSKIAREELREERRRESINAYKEKLRNRKSFWHKIFPFTIRIERRKVMAPTIIEQAKQELLEGPVQYQDGCEKRTGASWLQTDWGTLGEIKEVVLCRRSLTGLF